MYTEPIFCDEPLETFSPGDPETGEGMVFDCEPIPFSDVNEDDLAEMMSMFN